MRRPADFERAVRRGVRSGRDSLVLHLAEGRCGASARVVGAPAVLARPVVGFVVSKAVGNAVVRNRVKRRLRAVVRDRVADLPEGGLLVVRALPAAAQLESARLSGDFDRALRAVLRRLEQKRSPRDSS